MTEEKKVNKKEKVYLKTNFQEVKDGKGYWKFVTMYKATHNFVSREKDRELPKKVLDLLPESIIRLENNSKVKPTELSTKKIEVTDRYWIFDGWHIDEQIINKKGCQLCEDLEL